MLAPEPSDIDIRWWVQSKHRRCAVSRINSRRYAWVDRFRDLFASPFGMSRFWGEQVGSSQHDTSSSSSSPSSEKKRFVWWYRQNRELVGYLWMFLTFELHVSLYSMTLWYCFQILFPSNRKQNSRKAVPTMKTKTETWRIKSRKPQIWSPVFSGRKMWTQCVHHPSFELGGLESLLSWSESNRNTDS